MADDDVEILGEVEFSAFHMISTHRVRVGDSIREVSISRYVGDTREDIEGRILDKVYAGDFNDD